mgnify:CR=1 FL=1
MPITKQRFTPVPEIPSAFSRMKLGIPHPVDLLFDHLHLVRPYIGGMVEIPERLPWLAFFHGGDGLWKATGSTARPPAPLGGVMVLGNNFQCVANFQALKEKGEEDLRKDATWRSLLALLQTVDLHPSRCFFTNAFMGLVDGDDPTRSVPGMRDAGFVNRCRSFLLIQLQTLQPKVILALGSKVPAFLAPLSDDLGHWCNARRWSEIDRNDAGVTVGVELPGLDHPVSIACLLHPSFRGPNLRRRSFGGLTEAAAEDSKLWEPCVETTL